MASFGTTSNNDYLQFSRATDLVRQLYTDEKYRMSLFVGCGIFFGLRASELLGLKWCQILNNDTIVIINESRHKTRSITVNESFRDHIRMCYEALKSPDINQPCFLNKSGGVISIQMINRSLKDINRKYNLSIDHFSTHTLRKTWARQIWEIENRNGKGDLALAILCDMMSHSSTSVTRKYIGLNDPDGIMIWSDLQF